VGAQQGRDLEPITLLGVLQVLEGGPQRELLGDELGPRVTRGGDRGDRLPGGLCDSGATAPRRVAPVPQRLRCRERGGQLVGLPGLAVEVACPRRQVLTLPVQLSPAA